MHKLLVLVLFSVVSGWGGVIATAHAALPNRHNCENSGDKMRCLVCNCFHESRGEPGDGQVAVARVVLSRVMSSSYPNSVCGVVHQSKQFSWTSSKSKRTTVIGSGSNKEPAAYNKCVQSVNTALKSEGVWYGSHFHTTSIRPKWSRTCTGAKTIGRHIFYTKCGNVSIPRNNSSSGASGVN